MPSHKIKKASVQVVQGRWAALSVEQRRAVLRFDEPVLVDRIQAALVSLYQESQMMQQMLAACGGGALANADPLADAVLLKDAFQLSYQTATAPELATVALTQHAILVVKASFVNDLASFDTFKAVLPNFLADKSGRMPTLRARWKDLFAVQPRSVQAMEQQICKLAEQALWAMACDPAFEIQDLPISPKTERDDVQLEEWMVERDASLTPQKPSKRSRKAKNKKSLLATQNDCATDADSCCAESSPFGAESTRAPSTRPESNGEESLAEEDWCPEVLHDLAEDGSTAANTVRQVLGSLTPWEIASGYTWMYLHDCQRLGVPVSTIVTAKNTFLEVEDYDTMDGVDFKPVRRSLSLPPSFRHA